MSRKRIIVVEDERDMADLIAMRLTKEGYHVEAVHDGDSALKKIRAGKFDLVLLDVMLPGITGMDVLREMRNDPRLSATPVIMLTAKSAEADVLAGLRTGADDYVAKPFNMSVLAARVNAVLRRAAALPEGAEPLSIGPIRIDRDRHAVEVDGEAVSLTRTEFRMLMALAAARGKVLSRSQLVDETIGLDVVVTVRTIDVHLTALRRKLGPARDCVKTVRGVGYRLSADPNEIS